MKNLGFININLDNLHEATEEEITYYLFLNGYNVKNLMAIRRLPKEEIQRHIVEGKMKYKVIEKASNPKELLYKLCKTPKNDKIYTLNMLDKDIKAQLIDYIRKNYVNLYSKEKETALWVIGELKSEEAMDVLIKGAVHKFVNVKRMALSAMAKIGSKKGEAAVLRALEDENPQVVAYAIKALITINPEGHREKIQEIRRNSGNKGICMACDKYLGSAQGLVNRE